MEPYVKGKFSPEEYGYFDLYLKITPILTLFYTFKSEILIVSAKSNKIIEFLKSSLNQAFFTFICFLIISLILNNKIFLYSVIGAYFFSTIAITTIYFIKKGYNIRTAFQKPIRRLFEIFSLLLIMKLSIEFSESLIISSLVGLFVSSSFMLSKFGKEELKYFINIKLNREFFSQFFRLKGIFFSELLNIVSLSFLTLFVFSNYSSREMGFLELSNKFISVPQLVFSSVVGLIIQNRIGSLFSEAKPILSYIKKIFFFLLTISIIICGFYLIFIEYIIDILFVSEWRSSASFVILLLPHLFFYSIFSPLSRVLYGMNSEKNLKNWQLLKSFIVFSTSFFYWLDVSKYLIVYSVFSSISYLVLLCFLRKEILDYERKLIL